MKQIIDTKTREVIATVQTRFAYSIAQALRVQNREKDYQVIQ